MATSSRERRNLKISVGLHRRLKLWSTYKGVKMEVLAEEVMNAGLTKMMGDADLADLTKHGFPGIGKALGNEEEES